MFLCFTLFVGYFLKVLRDALTEASPSTSSIESSAKPSEHMGEEASTEEMPEDVTEEMQEVYNDVRTENPEDLNDSSCASCLALKGDNRKLRNQVKSLQCKLKERRKNLRKTRTQGVYSGKI